jgi:hypothetical protein
LLNGHQNIYTATGLRTSHIKKFRGITANFQAEQKLFQLGIIQIEVKLIFTSVNPELLDGCPEKLILVLF